MVIKPPFPDLVILILTGLMTKPSLGHTYGMRFVNDSWNWALVLPQRASHDHRQHA
jgi:hypothetical protein